MDLLDGLETFVRVVEAGSLSAAARSRGASLPAVSRKLAALEAELGVTLVVRTTRRLHVTDAGRRWYQRAVRWLGDVAAARVRGMVRPRTPSAAAASPALAADAPVGAAALMAGEREAAAAAG